VPLTSCKELIMKCFSSIIWFIFVGLTAYGQNLDYIKVIMDVDQDVYASEYVTASGKESSPSLLMAPPVNDNCANATVLTSNAACVNGTLDQATTEAGEYTASGCAAASPTLTVWYKFTATSTTMYVQMDFTSLVSGAVWCPSRLFARLYNTSVCQPGAGNVLDCDQHGDDGTIVLNYSSFIVGNTYLIQVGYNDASGCKVPNFCIEVGDKISCGTCAAPCGPACGFTSSPSVAQVTSVCPAYEQKPKIEANETKTQCYTFTANNSTVSFGVIVNTNCGTGGNVSNFSWTLQNLTCGAIIGSGNLSNLSITGLSIGSSYTFCYTFTALSYCYHSIHYPYFVGAVPLPVELINFEANTEKNAVVLQWSTASEINNDYFTIERSADGENFNEIAKVTGAGNSSFLKNYLHKDTQPLPGTNYYRLKQTDFDGQYTFSSIIAVKFEYNSRIKIIPNPAVDEVVLFFDSPVRTIAQLSISDMQGKAQIKEDFRVKMGMNSYSVDLSGILPGVYTVLIEINDNSLIDRIVIR
jgi:hypothetical protein